MANDFLLDTSVLSETSKPRPHPEVVRFLKSEVNVLVPAASLMEVQLGIMQIFSRDPLKAVRLSGWYQQVLSAGIPILPTDQDVAETWGILAAEPRLRALVGPDPRSKRLGQGQDLHIAAVALVHRLPIATINVKDFLLINECFPLPGVFNPLEAKWYAKPDGISFTFDRQSARVTGT
ncbi:PIN domain-containing protein [Sinorhizobium fredii]|uniref:PIN domain-containing protein n=1 Tax=Rhizobium fredii TaxID=380 RepID=UPI003518124C